MAAQTKSLAQFDNAKIQVFVTFDDVTGIIASIFGIFSSSHRSIIVVLRNSTTLVETPHTLTTSAGSWTSVPGTVLVDVANFAANGTVLLVGFQFGLGDSI